MDIGRITGAASPRTAGAQINRRGEFNSLLTKASDQQRMRGMGQGEKLRQSAEQLVSSALIKPLLKQMHASPFRVERFHGGQGEKAFMKQLNTVLADRITRSANFNLSEAIFDRMSRQKPTPPDAMQPSGSKVNTHG